MENQHNQDLTSSIQKFRAEIDAIDGQIISLFQQRMQVVEKVSEFKKNNLEKFFIKSSREADMIKELVSKASDNFPKSIIVNIWRKIITAANMREQKLNIAIHNPKNISDYSYLVREYYGDIVPFFNHDSATNIIAEIEKNQVNIGIFALPNNENEENSENWWINLANNRTGLKVFAKIPFVEFVSVEKNYNKIQLVAVAIKEAEKSNSDNSLFYVELNKEFSRSQLIATFKEQNIDVKILRCAKLAQVDGMLFYLLEASGFFTEKDDVLKTITKSKIKPYIKVIGNYATPILVNIE